ncbi:MAG TPA: rRNA maturation RNase YbeY [Vicinamibacterales bacterium]
MPADGQRVSPRLDVAVVDGAGRPLRARGLAGWLARVAPKKARGTVTLAVVSDARMRALNRHFRGVDAVTDVLSFPASPAARQVGHLGDIVIARGVARRQAAEASHAESTEWRVLALHGLLHLLGHDHERDGGAMRRLEAHLRRKGGLREGLIERGARG